MRRPPSSWPPVGTPDRSARADRLLLTGRKKKCSEVYLGDACTRCIKGKFICVQTSLRPSRAKRGSSVIPPDHSGSPSTSMSANLPTGIASTSSLPAGPPTHPDQLPPLGFGAALPAPPRPPQLPSALLQPLSLPDLSMPEFPAAAFPFADFDHDLSLYDLLGAVDAGAGGLDFLPSLIGPPLPSVVASSQQREQEPALSAEVGASASDSARTMRDLEDALGWEKELLAAPPDNSTLNEVRDFAHQWWSFCERRVRQRKKMVLTCPLLCQIKV